MGTFERAWRALHEARALSMALRADSISHLVVGLVDVLDDLEKRMVAAESERVKENDSALAPALLAMDRRLLALERATEIQSGFIHAHLVPPPKHVSHSHPEDDPPPDGSLVNKRRLRPGEPRPHADEGW